MIISKIKTMVNIVSQKEKISKVRLWISFFVNSAFYGFTPRQITALKIYKKKHKEKIKYINYWKAKKIVKKYNDKKYNMLFNEKHLFNETYKSFIKRKWFILNSTNLEAILEMLRKKGCLIAKPTNDYGGNGIKLIKKEEELISLVDKKYIVEEIVYNHHDIKQLSNCLNTIRVFTFLTDDKKVKVLGVYLRIGGGNSIVDNMHSGGHAVAIDFETGHSISFGKDFMGNEYLNNPLSGIPYNSLKIPNWNDVKDCIQHICLITPKCRYCGWDIAITENGVEVIEGNLMPDPNLLQLALGPCYSLFKE